MKGLSTNDDGYQMEERWQEAVLSILSGASSEDPLKVKKVRKQVLLSLQQDESSNSAKKIFKRTVQRLEEEGTLILDADGTVKLSKKRKKNEEKKSKKKKKSKMEGDKKVENDSASVDVEDGDSRTTTKLDASEDKSTGLAVDESNDEAKTTSDEAQTKNLPCKGNPQGVTRLFLGNLPFAVDETSLEAFIPGLTHVKWITDKETGKFYGSAFVEMSNSETAAEAVAKAGSELMGRPVKINFAAARPGDPWPPQQKVVSGGGSGSSNHKQTTGGQAGGNGIKSMSPKPDNCVKLFIGNLSYEIDDEGITKFFANVEAEVKAVRWLHHKDTGDFKGV